MPPLAHASCHGARASQVRPFCCNRRRCCPASRGERPIQPLHQRSGLLPAKHSPASWGVHRALTTLPEACRSCGRKACGTEIVHQTQLQTGVLPDAAEQPSCPVLAPSWPWRSAPDCLRSRGGMPQRRLQQRPRSTRLTSLRRPSSSPTARGGRLTAACAPPRASRPKVRPGSPLPVSTSRDSCGPLQSWHSRLAARLVAHFQRLVVAAVWRPCTAV
jgi:hypothetical protein